MIRLFLLATAFLSSYLTAQDDGVAIRIEGKQPGYKTERSVFSNVPIADLELRLIQGAYAVVKSGGVREAVQVGDSLGKESHLVLAIGPKVVLLETTKGYAELLRETDGRTRFRPMDRVFPSPDPKTLPPKGNR